MSNLNVNNNNILSLNVNNDEYWDFYVSQHNMTSYYMDKSSLITSCLQSYIDMGLYDCVFEDTINSINDYTWVSAISSGRTLKNIGYTGFDNGLLTFRKDRILNSDFLELYQHSTYKLPLDTTLLLHQVNGSTQVYDYPMTVNDYDVKLNGGFYQGFFKTRCDDYQTLPTQLDNDGCWAYEFVLKKSDLEAESSKTLNDKHPNNKGIFFYIGTRAENKWIYLYDKDNGDCFTLSPDDYVEDAHIDVSTYKINSLLDVSIDMPAEWESIALDEYIDNNYYDKTLHDSQLFNIEDHSDFSENESLLSMNDNIRKTKLDWCCESSNYAYYTKCEIFGDDYLSDGDIEDPDTDYVEPEIDISNFIYQTDNEFIIGKNEEYMDSDNKFLLFNWTNDGVTVNTWEEGMLVRYVKEKNTFSDNLFLLMNWTDDGYTVDTIDELRSKYVQPYDIYKDLYNNALAFRITDDGRIGYRYLVQNCDGNSKYVILEAYSKSNLIVNDKWYCIHIKVKSLSDMMKLEFYVNGNLVFISKELPKIQLRELEEIYEKQETVPYNISIGGGTQGLCDTILPNYMIEPYRLYPIEEHFAGTFIGFFKSFKFYTCDLELLDIQSNFNFEKAKWA